MSTSSKQAPQPDSGDQGFDASAPSIFEVAEELAAQVPDEVWEELPTDLAKNYRHYLYGTPKEKE